MEYPININRSHWLPAALLNADWSNDFNAKRNWSVYVLTLENLELVVEIAMFRSLGTSNSRSMFQPAKFAIPSTSSSTEVG